MLDKYKHIIANHSVCPDEEQLQRYVAGLLSPEQAHTIEKHLIDCPMCADMVEGLELLANSQTDFAKYTAEINTFIDNHSQKKERKTFQLNKIYKYAAAAALLIGLVYMFNFYNRWNKQSNPELAITKQKAYEASENNRFKDEERFVDGLLPVKSKQKKTDQDKNNSISDIPKSKSENKNTEATFIKPAAPITTEDCEIADELAPEDNYSKVEEAVASEMEKSKAEATSGSSNTIVKEEEEAQPSDKLKQTEADNRGVMVMNKDDGNYRSNRQLFKKGNRKATTAENNADQSQAPAMVGGINDTKSLAGYSSSNDCNQAIEYYNQRKYSEALDLFEKAISNKSNCKDSATYYKALCFIHLNKKEQAKKILEQIVVQQAIFYIEAENELEKLK